MCARGSLIAAVKKSATHRVIARFGLRVHEERVALGLTQEQFAERLGVEFQQVQRIEAGRANITLAAVFALGAALNVEPGSLFLAPRKTTVRRPGRPKKNG